MKLIKLGAIDSTNEFKRIIIKQQLENFTVVTADSQTKGKGQWALVLSLVKPNNEYFAKDF
jgi:BirA family biotin operon repressor/biotin-[acetyl-CoA-carboxylase] ligase